MIQKSLRTGSYDLLATYLVIICLNKNQRQTQLLRSFSAAGFSHPKLKHILNNIYIYSK